MTVIRQPYGAADVQTPAFSSTIGIDVTDGYTILEPGNVTGALTVDVDSIASDLPEGAILTMIFTDDGGANTVTFGSNLEGTSLSMGASEKYAVTAVLYSGSFRVTASRQLA